MMINRIGALSAAQNTFTSKNSSMEHAKYALSIKGENYTPGSSEWKSTKEAISSIIGSQLETDSLTLSERKQLERDKYLVDKDLESHRYD